MLLKKSTFVVFPGFSPAPNTNRQRPRTRQSPSQALVVCLGCGLGACACVVAAPREGPPSAEAAADRAGEEGDAMGDDFVLVTMEPPDSQAAGNPNAPKLEPGPVLVRCESQMNKAYDNDPGAGCLF